LAGDAADRVLVGYCASLDKETLERQTSLLANLLIFS